MSELAFALMPATLDLMYWPLLLVGAYVLGAVPFSQLIAKARGQDLRSVGTGNIGAGNLTMLFGWHRAEGT